MNFTEALKHKIILFDAPLGTRLQYEKHVEISSDFAIFDCINDAKVAPDFEELYRGDIQLAQRYELPLLINLPSLRASSEYMPLDRRTKKEVIRVNTNCYDFVAAIRDEFVSPSAEIFISAPVGTRYDAYSPKLALTAKESARYHDWQINALADLGIDTLLFTSMSSFPEALGCAQVAAKTHVPYLVSFILQSEGRLLDGSSLDDAIDKIDSAVSDNPPLAYLILCTHPSVAIETFANFKPQYSRIKGIKANASRSSTVALSSAQEALLDESPDNFAQMLADLTKQYDWRIVGGCCGTSRIHLEKLADKLVHFNA